MDRGQERYKCSVCRRSYPPDDLGRCQLGLWWTEQGYPPFDVVCKSCYAAILDERTARKIKRLPVYHGF